MRRKITIRTLSEDKIRDPELIIQTCHAFIINAKNKKLKIKKHLIGKPFLLKSMLSRNILK